MQITVSLKHLGYLAAAVLAAIMVYLPAAAQTDWQDYLPPDQPEAVEDDPAWDKYDFDLPLADESGRMTFKDLARSGDAFVIYWWLTNCPLCHLQMPYVQQLYQVTEEHGLPLRVVSICIDSDPRECLPTIEDKGLKYPVLIDMRARRTKEQYQIEEYGTPLTFIFDKHGQYVDKLSGFEADLAKIVFKKLDLEIPARERQE